MAAQATSLLFEGGMLRVRHRRGQEACIRLVYFQFARAIKLACAWGVAATCFPLVRKITTVKTHSCIFF